MNCPPAFLFPAVYFSPYCAWFIEVVVLFGYQRYERGPDFKHKETGQKLWLSNSPSWVLSKLPPLKAKERVETGGLHTDLSKEAEN